MGQEQRQRSTSKTPNVTEILTRGDHVLNGITSLLVLRWRTSLLWMISRPTPSHHGPTSRRHNRCHAETRPEPAPDVMHTAGVGGPQEAGTHAWGRAAPQGADDNC